MTKDKRTKTKARYYVTMSEGLKSEGPKSVLISKFDYSNVRLLISPHAT